MTTLKKWLFARIARLLLKIREQAARIRELELRLQDAEACASLAYVDPLTGLHNRRAVRLELSRLIESGEDFSVAVIDLDGFKLINDTHGHAVGDAVIKTVADAVRKECRASQDVVGRMGGDEFVVILRDTNKEQALVFMKRLQSEVSMLTHVAFEDVSYLVSLGASIGVGQYKVGQTIDGLLHEVDQAMYRSKQGEQKVTAA